MNLLALVFWNKAVIKVRLLIFFPSFCLLFHIQSRNVYYMVVTASYTWALGLQTFVWFDRKTGECVVVAIRVLKMNIKSIIYVQFFSTFRALNHSTNPCFVIFAMLFGTDQKNIYTIVFLFYLSHCVFLRCWLRNNWNDYKFNRWIKLFKLRHSKLGRN
jgi:hypothetical protein